MTRRGRTRTSASLNWKPSIHDALAVVKDLEGRMTNQQRAALSRLQPTRSTKTARTAAERLPNRPAAFEEQHRAELTAYRAAAAYFKANNITKLPSPKKLEAEYCAACLRKGTVLRAVQGSQGRTAQTERPQSRMLRPVLPGGRTDAASREIKECAYDQSENRPGVPVSDSAADGR